MVEQTLLFVKPDGVRRFLVGEVVSRFERKGYRLVRLKMMQLDDVMCDQHYQEHVQRDFYPHLKAYIMSGPVVVMVWEGDNVVASARDIIGATDPLDAAPGSIRGTYASSKSENIIHGSDSIESARREISSFFGNDT